MRLQICKHPGCKRSQATPYCDNHRKDGDEKAKEAARYRQNKRQYNTGSTVWRRIRAIQLASEPLCRSCKHFGQLEPATVVDHIDGNPQNNFQLNLQSLCKPCHDRKTAYEVGLPGRTKDDTQMHKTKRNRTLIKRRRRIARHLEHEPLCRICLSNNYLEPAMVIDHINGDTRDNRTINLQSLCRYHKTWKTWHELG